MSKTKKHRLDILLVERGISDSRERAQSLILSGSVLVNDHLIDKAGLQVDIDSSIRLTAQKDFPYVSRGGVKIDGALSHFKINVKDKICIDVGASTGGFTDCLLQHGAKKIYTIDVGYGQLHWRLRKDPRVTVFEKTNIRFFKAGNIPEEVDLAVIDVSFISLSLVLPPVLKLIKKSGEILALIKPQFEVGKGAVGKGGVVRDKEQHTAVLEKIYKLAKSIGLTNQAAVPSVLPGQKGNIEYFIYLHKIIFP